MLKKLFEVASFDSILSEKWVKPAAIVFAVIVIVFTLTSYAYADSGGFWDFLYGL